MSDDVQRSGGVRVTVDDDEECRLARIQAARRYGEICGLCGRAFAPGETVWLQRLSGYSEYGRWRAWWAPVGRECALPWVLRESEGQEPAPCAGCGRRVLGRAPSSRRTVVVCSLRCRGLDGKARAKEKRQ